MREERIATDAPVLPDAGEGDAVEAGTLVGLYREPLKRYFERRLHNRADAEDLAQEVLVRLVRKRLSARQTRPAYIFLTARSVLFDHARRNRVRARGDVLGQESALEVPSAERVVTAQEQVRRVSQLMARMTPRAQQVFRMHRIDGQSYTEIAQALGVTMGTVEKHMSAALLFIVQRMDEVER